MAKKPFSAKVVINRDALDRATLAIADGIFKWAQDTVTEAGQRAPDSPYDPFPTGEGLPKQGGVLAYVGNQKVNGWSIRGVQPKKPKILRLVAKAHAVVVAGGFGFPARYAEAGTINHRGQPFLTPTVRSREGEIPGYVKREVDRVR